MQIGIKRFLQQHFKQSTFYYSPSISVVRFLSESGNTHSLTFFRMLTLKAFIHCNVYKCLSFNSKKSAYLWNNSYPDGQVLPCFIENKKVNNNNNNNYGNTKQSNYHDTRILVGESHGHNPVSNNRELQILRQGQLQVRDFLSTMCSVLFREPTSFGRKTT